MIHERFQIKKANLQQALLEPSRQRKGAAGEESSAVGEEERGTRVDAFNVI